MAQPFTMCKLGYLLEIALKPLEIKSRTTSVDPKSGLDIIHHSTSLDKKVHNLALLKEVAINASK